MPGDVSVGDGMLHAPAILGCSLLEILVEQPRTGGPNIAAGARLAHCFRHPDRLGKELREVPSNDRGLGINKAGVEMALEHDKHTLDLFVGRLHGEPTALAGSESTSQRNHRFDELATLHPDPQSNL